MLPGGATPTITRLSKVLASLLVLVAVVDIFVPSTTAYLSLVPGRTLPCVWNLLTCNLVTDNLAVLAFNVAALILLARLVEPVYGSKEFLKFLGVVSLSCGVVVFVGAYVMFASTHEADVLYTQFFGFHGVAAGLVVAVKQVMGEQEAKLFGVVKINIKYLPVLFLLAGAGAIAALGALHQLPFLLIGFFSAYVYLRFYQVQQDTGANGDASEAFKFSGFFPAALAPALDPVATTLATIFRLKHAAPADSASAVKPGESMLGSDAVDANRRRERGAKALEERLGQKAASSAGGDEENPPLAQQNSGSAAAFFGTGK